MPPFTVNPNRFDPYKNFKFRVMWDGRYVAGVSHISGLRRTTETIEHREGGDVSMARRSPGRTRFDAIVLRRGITHDTAFEEWANEVWQLHAGPGSESSLKNFRKDVVIDVFNEAGQLVLRYLVFRCWVSSFEALPDLDANANAIALETLVLENEGWERDQTVVEPVEPSISRAAPPRPGRSTGDSSPGRRTRKPPAPGEPSNL